MVAFLAEAGFAWTIKIILSNHSPGLYIFTEHLFAPGTWSIAVNKAI